MVVPSQAVRSTARKMAPFITKGEIIVLCSKGLEEDTGLRLSQVVLQELPDAVPVALYGPSHAEEVAIGIPTTVVAASGNEEAAMKVQDLFMSEAFRVYTSSDLIGAEIGSALKNVIALCAGICDGLGYGDNSKAALMSRGIIEIARLGTAMGANSKTFSGLTGIGDLIGDPYWKGRFAGGGPAGGQNGCRGGFRHPCRQNPFRKISCQYAHLS